MRTVAEKCKTNEHFRKQQNYKNKNKFTNKKMHVRKKNYKSKNYFTTLEILLPVSK